MYKKSKKLILKNELNIKASYTTRMSSSSNLAKQYQRKTDRQHILDNPDTYIGSVENVDANMWIWNEETKKIQLKEIEYIPGLYKIFDEILVNGNNGSNG